MSETIRRIRPTPTNDYLANPHKGCCTFQRFNGDETYPGVRWSEEGPTEFPPAKYEPVAPAYLPTTVAYCRWFWDLLEPRQGQYDFSVIEKSLEVCKQRGQMLAVRLMAFGGPTQPQTPKWYLDKYPVTTTQRGGVNHVHPDHDSKEYLQHWGALVREAGKRFDKHPQVESIDITYIGPWGEGAGECTRGRCAEFAQLWKEAWPTTPRLALIAGQQMGEAVKTGSGWRCDCFGDLGMFGSGEVTKNVSFNHHFDCYPSQVCICKAQDAWKTAPVHFETCGVPTWWYREGFDLEFILEQGYKFHGTYFMPKSCPMPEPWLERLSAFCRKLGYRFIPRQVMYNRSAAPGAKLRFQAWIENVGVAPIYRRYDFALRLRQGDQSVVFPFKDVDIRNWLPGDAWLDLSFEMPKTFRPGWADLSAGLIDPVTKEAKVNFAVKERYNDRWIDLGGIEVG